jgi:hypothetical protein
MAHGVIEGKIKIYSDRFSVAGQNPKYSDRGTGVWQLRVIIYIVGMDAPRLT